MGFNGEIVVSSAVFRFVHRTMLGFSQLIHGTIYSGTDGGRNTGQLFTCPGDLYPLHLAINLCPTASAN